MDWQSSMGMYPPHDEEQQDEDNEDFYGNGIMHEETKPGAEEQQQDVGSCGSPFEDALTLGPIRRTLEIF